MVVVSPPVVVVPPPVVVSPLEDDALIPTVVPPVLVGSAVVDVVFPSESPIVPEAEVASVGVLVGVVLVGGSTVSEADGDDDGAVDD